MRERWYVNGGDGRTFDAKIEAEGNARALFPNENVEQRYARVHSKPVQYACPVCGSVLLELSAVLPVKLLQDSDGNFQTVYDGGDHEWDNSHTMWCTSCKFAGMAASFDLGGE